jgi:hypothetical protein
VSEVPHGPTSPAAPPCLSRADVVASGVNIGQGDAKYVAQSYVVTLLSLGTFMSVSRSCGWEVRRGGRASGQGG